MKIDPTTTTDPDPMTTDPVPTTMDPEPVVFKAYAHFALHSPIQRFI